MTLSDLKAFESWFHERVGISYAEAQQRGCTDLRTIKAAYAAGFTRGTQETMKLLMRPLQVDLPAGSNRLALELCERRAQLCVQRRTNGVCHRPSTKQLVCSGYGAVGVRAGSSDEWYPKKLDTYLGLDYSLSIETRRTTWPTTRTTPCTAANLPSS